MNTSTVGPEVAKKSTMALSVSGIRSGLQPKSYAFLNGAINSGLGLIRNNIKQKHGTSDGYLNATTYVNSPKHVPQHFDQHHKHTYPSTYNRAPN